MKRDEKADARRKIKIVGKIRARICNAFRSKLDQRRSTLLRFPSIVSILILADIWWKGNVTSNVRSTLRVLILRGTTHL